MVVNVFLEGMPGIGKSTVLDLLGKQSAELGLLCQPVREKRDYIVGGQPMDLLDNFYQSPTRDNFMSLQMGIINASYRRHHIANKMTSQCDVRVFERSMTVSREIFLPLGYRFLDGWQNQLLNDHLHLGIDMFESEAKHVYLICKEDENIRRVIHRGRKRDSILSVSEEAVKSFLELKRFMDFWATAKGFHTIDTTEMSPSDLTAAIYDHLRENYFGVSI